MVITAIIIALPLSYFMVNEWISNFAYRINLEWWFFAEAGIITILLVWITIGLQTYKAATLNPSQCLRDE